MVFDLVRRARRAADAGDRHAHLPRHPHRHRLVPLLVHLAAHVRICRQCVEAGVDPPAVARSIFDSNSLGRLKLIGAVLSTMQLDPSGRLATVYVDRCSRALRRHLRGHRRPDQPAAHGEGDPRGRVLQGERPERLARQPALEGRRRRRAVAKEFGGGGHKNASGCSAAGPIEELKAVFREKITEPIDSRQLVSRHRASHLTTRVAGQPLGRPR